MSSSHSTSMSHHNSDHTSTSAKTRLPDPDRTNPLRALEFRPKSEDSANQPPTRLSYVELLF